MLSPDLTAEIVESLKLADPYKIILFGSHAYGEPTPDSDIDLLVITDDEFIPENFAEKNQIYLKVASTISEIEKRLSIDLIVHTKGMHEKFKQMGGAFSREVHEKGAVLYEKPH